MPAALTRRRRSPVIGQGSVALADILANGVAVILILIAVTLAQQEQKAQQELEQNADITSIMARQISSTIVYNDLPTSPPARLHDYHSCEIAHDCNHGLFPVLELLNGYIRIFNTNTHIYRSELLRENNALDSYLNSLNPDERTKIRLDIHHVNEYYLLMAILKDHQIRAGHWHFVGESTAPLHNPIDANIAGRDRQDKQPGKDRFGSQVGEEGSRDEDGAQLDQSILTGTMMADAQQLQNLQYDSLLPPDARNIVTWGTPEDQRPLGQSGANAPARTPTGRLEALFGDPGGGERRLRLYMPDITTAQMQETLQIPMQYYNEIVFSYLLKILALAREQRSLVLPDADEWLHYYANNFEQLENEPHYRLVTRLADWFVGSLPSVHPPLEDIRLTPGIHNNRLLIRYNRPLPDARIQIHQPTAWLDPLKQAGQVQASFLLRLYPGLFRGERLDVPKGYTLLLHPQEMQHPEPGWRPIAVLDSTLGDISLGFVHAAIIDGQIALSAGPNQLYLNQIPVSNPVISKHDIAQSRAPLIWLLGLAGLIWLLRRLSTSATGHNRNKQHPQHGARKSHT